LCGESTTSFSFQFMLAFKAVGADAFAIAQDADDKKRHIAACRYLTLTVVGMPPVSSISTIAGTAPR